MSTESTPLLGDPAIQDNDKGEIVLKPSVDIDAFMDRFAIQYIILIIPPAVLAYPAYAIRASPEISSSWPLRATGLLPCHFNTVCLAVSSLLRLRAWEAKREGHTEQFAKDIASLRIGPARSRQAAVAVKAPGWLMVGSLAALCVELIGYIYLRRLDGPAGAKAPLHVVEILLRQALIIATGVFVYLSVGIIGKLGKPPAPAPEVPQADQVAAVQEKV